MPVYRTLSTGVLVIGGGAAGLRAALEAGDQGIPVLVAVKGHLYKSGSSFSRAVNIMGFQSFLPEDRHDTAEGYLSEIINAGEGMCDASLASILVQEGHDRIKDLMNWGVSIPRKYAEDDRVPCFSQNKRVHCIHNPHMLRTAFNQELKKRHNIEILNHVYITSLNIQDKQCIGALGILESGEYIVINAGAVILSSGGAAALFTYNLNSPDLIGDGYVLALEAGAELYNMEFIQFIYGICHPQKLAFNHGYFANFPKILNADKREFINNYIPEHYTFENIVNRRRTHGPFTSRLISKYFDIAIFKEILAGHATPHGGVYVEFSHPEDTFRDTRVREWLTFLKKKKLEPGGDVMLEIAPHAHAFNGGVRIDANGQTSVPGLFAAGEVAAGPHGADRLGGNMMTATQVFGARAGRSAASYAHSNQIPKTSRKSVKEYMDIFAQKYQCNGKLKTGSYIRILKKMMWSYAGVCRTETGLRILLDKINEFEDEVFQNISLSGSTNLLRAISFRHMLVVSKMIATSALIRRESRGSHYRDDFQEKDDLHCKSPIYIRKQGNQIVWT